MSDGYSFEFRAPTIHQGATALDRLRDEVETRELERVIVVTSPSVADSDPVMDHIRDMLGPRLTGVFDEVSPSKYLQTAVEGALQAREAAADAVVGLGGGSSLDVAKIVGVLLGHGDDLESMADRMVEAESVLLPDGPLPPLFGIPTTLPGAEISQVAGVTFSLDPERNPKGEAPSGVASDPRLMPDVVCYDHRLYRETPTRVLARSAMNGFDKGIEMVYSRNHTPVTDATAVRGLGLLARSLPTIADEPAASADLDTVLNGIALVQYGLSSPRAYRASIIHAFGHALTGRYPIQQGTAHAIAAPHVLEYLFGQVDGRRGLLAEAFDVQVENENDTHEKTADSIVDAVETVRNSLDLPARLRTVDAADRADFPELAISVLEDSFMAAAPEGLEPTQSAIESVFEAMW